MRKYDITLDRDKLDPLNIMIDNIKPNSVVLEFGCANGRMTKVLSQQLNCQVYIVEIDSNLFEEAILYAKNGICGDILQYEWIDKFRDIQFDYAIFADVLEHLSSPQEVLYSLRQLLKKDGKIWISVPNIAHNDILLKLYEDKFEYTATGLLDNTHIHFFTLNAAKQMFREAGYEVVFEDANCVPIMCTEQMLNGTVPDIDLLQVLEERKNGNIYQFIFELIQKDYAEGQICVSKIKDHSNLIERRVFFDTGKGFNDAEKREYYELKSNQAFSMKIELPENVKVLRVEPALRTPCKISNLKVYTEKGQIQPVSYEAKQNGNDYTFDSFNGCLNFVDLQQCSWISLIGEIDYNYDYAEKSSKSMLCDLREVYDELEDKYVVLKEKYNECFHSLQEKQAQLLLITKENEQLFEEKEELLAERERLLVEKEEIKAVKEALVTEKDAQINEWRGRYELVYKSTSWKITKPFRVIKRSIGKLMKGVKPKERVEVLGNSENINSDLNVCTFSDEKVERKVVQQWRFSRPYEAEQQRKVSIIVPNFNHGQYLRERLDSIYNQTYSNYEVILLDDCSSDNSREILEEYAQRYSDKTKVAFNDENCGKVFKQWNKGIALASGELIWIAESDDYCDKNFLEVMVPLLQDEAVMLAFARSVFVQNGKQIWTTEEYLGDIPEIDWTTPFCMTANMIVQKAFSIKNIIPNVSSALFRNSGLLSRDVEKIWERMSLSGDWIFYLNQIRGGCISYTNATTNYYRVHEGSTSLKVQHTMEYYEEYAEVSKYIAEHYIVPAENYEKILFALKEHYKAIHEVADADIVSEYYNIDEIKYIAKKRMPNVIMACFALKSGGGETYPLYLANEMKRQDIAVSVIDFGLQDREDDVRQLLHPSIPLVETKGFDSFYEIVSQLGGEVIHSHHTSVDEAVATWLKDNSGLCSQIITLHGMYETLTPETADRVIPLVESVCKHFIYIADKNIQPFIKRGCFDNEKFDKLPNGLPLMQACPVSRAELNIGEDDFVLCVVSRGIPEKGWKEAVQAVTKANEKSTRKIHLVIVGDGECREDLENNSPENIHFVGVKKNVRDYYAMADMGFLPTRFKGESYPLVVIESLQCGKPVLATDIAEVRNQLTDENGQLAGELLSMENWQLDIDEITEKIVKIANEKDYYKELQSRCLSASKKFDIESIVKDYLKIYQKNIKN